MSTNFSLDLQMNVIAMLIQKPCVCVCVCVCVWAAVNTMVQHVWLEFVCVCDVSVWITAHYS